VAVNFGRYEGLQLKTPNRQGAAVNANPNRATTALRVLVGGLSAVLLLAASIERASAQAPPLTLKVITVSEASLYANMTLVMGKSDAALIDVPFTRSDAHRVIADILETGKTLKYVYITHDHPDHFMSLEVLADAFPDAKLITAPTVVADIWRSLPAKLKRWGPMLGANGPRRPVVPVAWERPAFQIEGQDLQILGPMQGDHVHATAIYIPSLRAIIAGDLVFDQIYPWLGEHTPERRKAWIGSLDRLIALKPAIVVAGHQLPGRPHDPSALAFTRDYIVAFNAAIARSKNSEDLARRMRMAFPEAQDVLGGFLMSNSAKVGMGEAQPWDE
jgi:glyoxylase-like metal-dependent hydrolase (beta-lactamase superfamily II)